MKPRINAAARWAAASALCLTALLPVLAFAAAGDAAEAHSADAAHSESKGLVEIAASTVLWTLVVFAIVAVILKAKAWGPLIKALDEREQRIRDSLEAADRARAESLKAAAEHERVLAEARKQATAIVEEGKRDALAVKDSIIAEARKESDELKTRALNEIERAKNNAVYEIHDRAVELSYQIAEKLISKSLSREEHAAMVKKTVEQYQHAAS
ncbi:MAG: F0F1 ATP synthase subunit B [Planctomycetota bacterium]